MGAEGAATSDPYQVSTWEESTAEEKLAELAKDKVKEDVAADGASDDEDTLKKKHRGRGVARFARPGDFGNGRSRGFGYDSDESEPHEKPQTVLLHYRRPEDWQDEGDEQQSKEDDAVNASSGGSGSAADILAGFRQKWKGKLTGKLVKDTPPAQTPSDWSTSKEWPQHSEASEWQGSGGGDAGGTESAPSREAWGASWNKKENWDASWQKKEDWGDSWHKKEDWQKKEDWGTSWHEKGSPGVRGGCDSKGQRRCTGREWRDEDRNSSRWRDADSRDGSRQRGRSARDASRRDVDNRNGSRRRERSRRDDRRRDFDSRDSSRRRGRSVRDGRKRRRR